MRMASWHWGGRDHAGTISPDGREATRPSPSSARPPVEGVTLCAPLPRPLRSLGCIGRNCHAHARERVGTVFRETLRGWISSGLRGITLHPGGVIATGTPAGVGMRLKPPQWLKHGDGVRIEIGGIGTIENRLESD